MAGPGTHHDRPRSRRSPMDLLLAAAVVLILAAAVTSWLYNRSDHVRVTSAERHVDDTGSLGKALDRYRTDIGRYPTTAQGLDALIRRPTGEGADKWRGPYLPVGRRPVDPWQRAYDYAGPGDAVHRPGRYDLSSPGPDGVSGTADDIVNWRRPDDRAADNR